jgi:hypothetical protein
MAIFRVPARITYTAQGGPGVNVFHISTQPGGQPGDLGEALDALEAFYRGMVEVFAPGTSITIGEGIIRDPLGTPEYVDDDSRTIATGGGGGSAPPLLAVVCGWRTTSATRSGRGRTFIGPVARDTLQQDGTVNGDQLTAIRLAATGLVDDSQSANGWALGVLSVQQGVFRDVTGVTVRDRLSFLTSRRD